MDEKKQKQHYDEEFAPEISPGYRQDVHKPPQYKNTSTSFLIGIGIFGAILLVLIIFVYF
ncbi:MULTISPECIES: 2-isopropylmalate synthase [unclassified Bacillus (in: firmicutes)]|uniref:2-isopropylmalate synthase n=1 Tax=Bacillus TaxID=1386 RepID=UPI001572279D|nr:MULTISPECIES: 2-isopropylmalate synthase [unclassified Bacillus (in: firmicutes)]MBC6975684.1 2-isopropylmalate synthase [Bacillus sp. Xin]NSW35313.1 2-isopropylmalate synthase [Bacillus sp. Xin1]